MITIKLTEKEFDMIRNALMASNYAHCDDLSEQGFNEEEAKVMRSAFKKFVISLS